MVPTRQLGMRNIDCWLGVAIFRPEYPSIREGKNTGQFVVKGLRPSFHITTIYLRGSIEHRRLCVRGGVCPCVAVCSRAFGRVQPLLLEAPDATVPLTAPLAI